MNTIGQWVHQHNFLLLCVAVVGGAGLLLAWRRPRLRWWFAWLGVAAACLAAVFALHTPAASLAERKTSQLQTVDLREGESAVTPAYSAPVLTSVEAIEAEIAGGGKPTLVEFHADYGLS